MTFAAFANEVLIEIGDIPAVNADLKKHGMKRLEAAAQALPVTLEELAVFFADDLQSFGTGEVSQAGIRKACEWYAYQYKGRAGTTPQEPDNRVTCTTCKQDKCPYPLAYGRHNSPQPRNCTSYTPFDGNIKQFRRATP